MADVLADETIDTFEEQQCVPRDGNAFQPTWQRSDAALLQPSNLALPKLVRAWERKPLSPFSRQRLRVGKVWKRPVTAKARYAIGDAAIDGRSTKRRRAGSPSQAATKPVKKMCVDSRFGMSASVVGWEICESPVRKIVTRSTAVEEDIVALPDEEDIEQSEQILEPEDSEDPNATIEILDDDGTVLEVDPEDDGLAAGWEDDDVEDGGAIASEILDDAPADLTIAEVPPDEETEGADELMAPETEAPDDAEQTKDQDQQQPLESNSSEAPLKVMTELSRTFLQTPAPTSHSALPEGFVSPVKRRQGQAQRRALLSSRRRTLPVQFAPAKPAVASHDEAVLAEATLAQGEVDLDTAIADIEAKSTDESSTVPSAEAIVEQTEPDSLLPEQSAAEAEWEDIEEDTSTEQDAMKIDDIALVPHLSNDAQQREEDISPHSLPDVVPPLSPARLPSSPIPTIEGRHPRLPLRRSPRRKSSSPLKQSTFLSSTEKPHLVAFTPLKGRALFLDPVAEDNGDDAIDNASPIERAASAPPEEPSMSGRKPAKPRVSDDTALLQAFLDRAAGNRGTRRVSATRRESIENRRDSDSVRQALASPAKPDVLGDLDPNSPSPRKPLPSTSNVSDTLTEADPDATSKFDETAFDDTDMISTSRRSSRTRKAQQSTPAPNKISIRGSADNVVLKRTDAQELALLTRNNTKKNKGGSVLPPLRLTKIAIQLAADGDSSSSQDTIPDKPEGAKGIRWAETLVEFYQGGDVLESSVLSDELNGPSEQIRAEMEVSTTAAASAPPPADTPSKPRIRKLKAPRTASAPGKIPSAGPPASIDGATISSTDKTVQQRKQKIPASTTKRRSRIATPAKGLTNASLLPSDVDPQPVVPALPQKIKKAAVSKLPAPANAIPAISTSLGQGKENSLLSSPPKKKTAANSGLPSVRNFAPRIDFGGKAKFEISSTSNSRDENAMPGLMSPAKKGARSKAFGYGQPEVQCEKEIDAMPGLGSPAKKRSRRLL